jgi:hypothetical protein
VTVQPHLPQSSGLPEELWRSQGGQVVLGLGDCWPPAGATTPSPPHSRVASVRFVRALHLLLSPHPHCSCDSNSQQSHRESSGARATRRRERAIAPALWWVRTAHRARPGPVVSGPVVVSIFLDLDGFVLRVEFPVGGVGGSLDVDVLPVDLVGELFVLVGRPDEDVPLAFEL